LVVGLLFVLMVMVAVVMMMTGMLERRRALERDEGARRWR
jgi:hypothetical protein